MSSEEDEAYELEAIVKDRSYHGKALYLVKWKGFPASQNTWEPARHLPPELIEDYLAHKGDGGSKRQPSPPPKQQGPVPDELEAITAINENHGTLVATVRMASGKTSVLPTKEIRTLKPRLLLELMHRLAT
jgi:hypothetical protein